MQEQMFIFFVFISMQDHTVEKWLVFVPYCKKVTNSIPSFQSDCRFLLRSKNSWICCYSELMGQCECECDWLIVSLCV